MRLGRLLPGLAELAASAKTLADRSMAAEVYDSVSRTLTVEFQARQFATLHLKLVEQCRFTSTLDLAIVLPEAELANSAMLRELSELGMTVRLYHDVKLAEVVSMAGLRLAKASYSYPNELMFLPDEKAQQNRLLGEWLSLSLQHGFTANTDMFSAFAGGSAIDAASGGAAQ